MRLSVSYHRLLGFLRQDWVSCLLFFAVGLVLRGVPDLMVSWFPVGYETVSCYAPAMLTFSGRGLVDVLVGFFSAGPLFFGLMWLVVNVTGAHAFVILKVVGPVLFGGLVVSFFVFLRRGLRLEWRLAFLASLLLVFQIAALRESWDRFRTVLGLVFLFWALTALRGGSGGRRWWFVGLFSVLVVLSREYVALVLFVSVLVFAFWEGRDRVRSLAALGPAFVVFVFVSLGWSGFVSEYGAVGLAVTRGYVWVVQDAFVIFAVCYLGLLPFVVAGLRREKLLSSMSVWLLLASFSVVVPFLVVPGYQRWLLLLVFPFCVFAVWGFERLRLFSGRRVWALAAVLLSFMLVGVGYSSGWFSYVGYVPNSYVAVDLVESSIRWDEVDDVQVVLRWLDDNAVSGSAVLVEECFLGWTLMYFDRADIDVSVVAYGAASSPMLVLDQVLQGGFSRVYLVWFSECPVDGFGAVFSWNAVSVFEYVGVA